MTLTVGMITCNRKPSYIRQTLHSYSLEWDEPIIFAPDYGAVVPSMASPTLRLGNGLELGAVRNWLRLATWMKENRITDHYLIMEDDIEWTVGSARAVRALLMYEKPTGMVSPYCSINNSWKNATGWFNPRMATPTSWCGALSIVLSRQALVDIVNDSEFFIAQASKAFDRPIHLDCAISATLLKHRHMILTHGPSLVLHTGTVSTFSANNTNEAECCDARLPFQGDSPYPPIA